MKSLFIKIFFFITKLNWYCNWKKKHILNESQNNFNCDIAIKFNPDTIFSDILV